MPEGFKIYRFWFIDIRFTCFSRILLVMFLFTVPFFVQSQNDTANLVVFASPGEYYRVKINHELLPVGNRFVVPEGQHNIKIWAPNFVEFDTTIYVKGDKIIITKELEKTKEFIKYESLNAERKQAHTKILLSGLSFTVLGLGAGLNYNLIGTNNLKLIKAQYHADYPWIGRDINELPEAEKKHRNSKIRQGIIYSGIGISALILTRNIIKRSKVEKPFLPVDNAFEITDIGFVPTNGKYPGLYLKININ